MSIATKRQAAVAFNTIWRLRGKPILMAVKPISAWVLATGISYDKYQDQFTDASGDVVAVDWRIQPYTELAFLPFARRSELAFMIPGIVTTSSTTALLLWTQDTENTLRSAWGVVLSNRLYRVRNVTPTPEGVTTPISIRLELEESKQTV